MKKTASVFIPHYGCPNDCVFCNQVKIAGTTTNLDYEKMKKDILRDLSTMKEDTVPEIAFFGGSFTAIEDEVQEKCLKMADDIRNEKYKNLQIKMSTRPDAIDDKVIERLKRYKVNTVELGVQSMDDHVLELSERGHDSKSVYEASKLIKEAKISLGIQLMIGLPGDSEEKLMDTMQKVIQIHPDIVRIYPVLVITDTKLEKMYKDGRYKAVPLEKAVQLSKILYKNFEKNNIKVIRMGLQATDNINTGKDVVAGPFHSAFGQLVISSVIKDNIEEIVRKNDIKNTEIKILTNPKYISDIVGNKKTNSRYFYEKYRIKFRFENTNQDIIKILENDIRP